MCTTIVDSTNKRSFGEWKFGSGKNEKTKEKVITKTLNQMNDS